MLYKNKVFISIKRWDLKSKKFISFYAQIKFFIDNIVTSIYSNLLYLFLNFKKIYMNL